MLGLLGLSGGAWVLILVLVILSSADAFEPNAGISRPARAAAAANQEANEKSVHPLDRPGFRRGTDSIRARHVWLARWVALVRGFAVAGEFLGLPRRGGRGDGSCRSGL